jgi:epoxyqueuosine reductase QueG
VSLYNEKLTLKVKEYAKNLGASLVGIASAEVLNEGLEEDFRPEDVLPGCRSVVVVSLHIPDGSMEIMRRGIANYSYNLFGYTYLNRELDFLAYRLSNFIEDFGYSTLPIPGRGCAIGARKPGYGMLSFRHCAVAAGLASFGLNGLALTPQYGSRQRFLGLPTTAPLRPADKFMTPAEVCDGCLECVAHCPSQALEIKEPHVLKMAGQTFKFARAIPNKCRIMASGLSTKVWPGAKFNPKVDVPVIEDPTAAEVYHQLWAERDGRLRVLEHSESTFGATNCGRCMAFCTAGHEAMKRRLLKSEKETGYADDNVLAKDETIKSLVPKPKAYGRQLLGLSEN